MIINVTEEQKRLIESQGYMVVEFKLCYKKLTEQLTDFAHILIDAWKAIILFLQDMMLKSFDSMKSFADRIMEEYRPFIDTMEPEYNNEPRRKYPFVRSIGRKYEFNYSRVTIYHRCRDRC